MDVLELSKQNQLLARNILEESRMILRWEGIGATVCIVGSLKTGLLIHRDIDLHIYTDTVSVAESFSVMKELAGDLPLKEICYKNLLDTEEECIEWHALYEGKGTGVWKFDMIHLRRGSKYDGVVEKVTDAILRKLTPELRETILRIKYDMPEGNFIPGIEVYHAVFSGNVRSYGELIEWRKVHPFVNGLDWIP